MNIEIWCKSFLAIYNVIPNLTNSIDKLIALKSKASSGFSYSTTTNTYNQLNNISSLIQKKINLINLKLLCDEVLTEINKTDAKIILLRYIDQIPCEKVIGLLNMSRRTYFRKLQKALKNFELCFYVKVLKNNTLYKNFAEDMFFNEIFEKINLAEEKLKSSNNEDNLTSFSNNVCGMILNKMKKAF